MHARDPIRGWPGRILGLAPGFSSRDRGLCARRGDRGAVHGRWRVLGMGRRFNQRAGRLQRLEHAQRPLRLPPHQRRLGTGLIGLARVIRLASGGFQAVTGVRLLRDDADGEHRLGRVAWIERGDRGHGENVAIVAGGFRVLGGWGKVPAEGGEDGPGERTGEIGKRIHQGPG